MAAALYGIYVVRKGEYIFVIAVVILHCNLDACGILFGFNPACGEIDGVGMQKLLIFIQVPYILDYSALIMEDIPAHGVGAFIRDVYADARI